jgi:protein O-GlcNAc transferase
MKKNETRFDSRGGGGRFAPEQGRSRKSPSKPAPELASLFGQALAFHQAGRLMEAEPLYRKVLQAQPSHFDSLHLLGVIHYQRGEHAEALRQIDAALKVNPHVAAAHNNRGGALKDLGRLEEALASYDRAIALKPDYVDAFYNRGNVLKDLGRLDDVVASYDKAIALKPDYVEAFNNRGSALKELERHDEALASYDRAVALRPNYAEAVYNRANLLTELKRYEEAVASCERAIALKPDLAEAFNNRGNALKELSRFDEALASYDRAIALKPDYAEAYNNRGFALREMKRLEEARASFAKALEVRPDLDYVRGIHFHAKMHLCDWSNFAEDCAALDAAVARGAAAALPFQLLATPLGSERQLQCAATYVSDKYSASRIALWQGERYGHPRIRVAYLSADLRDHPVGHLIAGLFERHDKTRFETTAISFKSDGDHGFRERLCTSLDRFVDAERISDSDVARLLRELEIDIAVDLNGFTEGLRPHVFALRPAPIQVNYLGYAGTLGQSYWDYILADRFVIPEQSAVHYAEQVVYLPDTFMVTDGGRKMPDRTPSRAEAGLPENGVVFCCFNNSFKITPHLFDIWMRLLREVQNSLLWLSATNPTAASNLKREAQARGVPADRLIFAPRVASIQDHLARLRLADLFLDTLYYNAHATAVDALWAGVPVLTCAGETFASRVAGSLLRAVGLPELITWSLDDYEALALRLVREPARLAAIRGKLAANRETYPLFDTGRFVRHIEAAYATMWERYQRGEPPRSFGAPAINRRFDAG